VTLHEEVRQRIGAVEEICRRYGVREIAVFGSALRLDAAEVHDLDLLVDFAPDASVGFLAFERLRRELSSALGKPVDLVSRNGLKSAIRDDVLREAQVLYAA
jgi:hypothetical protein